MNEKILFVWHECYYNVSTYKVEYSCHFMVALGSCMTCHQMLQGFPFMGEILLHRNSKITCLYFETWCKSFFLTTCRPLQIH